MRAASEWILEQAVCAWHYERTGKDFMTLDPVRQRKVWEAFLEHARGKWIEYYSCGKYKQQSDPQDNSIGKMVIVTDEKCPDCHERDVREAQALMGKMGMPKKAHEELHGC